MHKAKLVKLIGTKNYEVELLRLQDGAYHIRYMTKNVVEFSESIPKFETATMLFDMKVEELENSYKKEV